MKNLHRFFVIITIALLSTLNACHKHEDDKGDIEAPVLIIENPTEGASIQGEVHIHGKVTDASLHEMKIIITRDSDGFEYHSVSPSVHDKTEYNFDTKFTPTGLTAETPVTLRIEVEDHSDHTTTKTVKFKVKA